MCERRMDDVPAAAAPDCAIHLFPCGMNGSMWLVDLEDYALMATDTCSGFIQQLGMHDLDRITGQHLKSHIRVKRDLLS